MVGAHFRAGWWVWGAYQAAQTSAFRPSTQIIVHLPGCTLDADEAQLLPYANQASGIPSDVGLHLIALQLLASCYTLMPGSSAECLPIFEQTDCTVLSALRLHLRYRSYPAAGHHARNTSETSVWPGLYRGPSLEERFAETRSRPPSPQQSPTPDWHQRYPYVDPSSPGGWSDGPASPRHSPDLEENISTASGSSRSSTASLKGLYDKLIRPTAQLRRRRDRSRSHTHSFTSPTQSQTLSQPSGPRFRLRLSLPPEAKLRRNNSEGAAQDAPYQNQEAMNTPDPNRPPFRRTSSTPAPCSHPWIIPKIRRISATTVGDNESTLGIYPDDPLSSPRYLSSRPSGSTNTQLSDFLED